MVSKQAKSKGLVITLSLILESLFAIGVVGLLYWIFLNRILEMHIAINETTNEIHAINLANVLISSEKLAYEKEGKIIRGILDVDKLDGIFARSNQLSIIPVRDIGIGYPNSISIVRVIDMEKCDYSNNCEGWIVYLSGPLSIEGFSPTKFTECLIEHTKLDVGSLFRLTPERLIFGVSLWQPLDVENCVKNNVPPTYKSLFSESQASSKGFPIILRYSDGDLHLGRITVAVGEFV